MKEKIESVLRDRCKLDKSRPVLAGVSGGPDSLCLMQVLRQAGYPLILAHFNHRLRPESDAEAAVVEEIAARLEIPVVAGSDDVRAYGKEQGLSIEEAARHLRYRFLFDQARRRGAQAVAVGHTADDQVETVLMHFLRGAGLNGLKGMTYSTILRDFDPSIPIVRPLLDTWRAETVAYCAANGLQPSYDPSNDSPDFLRNRLRNVLIPSLETYNPKFREVVWRGAQSLNDDHILLQKVLDETWQACVIGFSPDRIIFDNSKLSGLPVGLQRHLIRRSVESLRPGVETAYATLERAAGFMNDPSRPKQIDLVGGLHLFREEDCIYVSTSETFLPSDHWPQMPEGLPQLDISLPGRIDLLNGWHLIGETRPVPTTLTENPEHNKDPFRVWLDAAKLPAKLELRARRRGDRFEPLGMDGHSLKLSDFLVNVKLPQRARERWPLLCSKETVIWVPGFRLAHRFRLTSSSQIAAYFAILPPPGKPSSQ